MATKIRGRQIETGDFIRTNTASNVDWTNDTETASQAAIAAKIASSGVKEITSDYKVWQLSEGLYHVDGSANMNYGGGYFRPYTNYYLFVLNYSGYSDRKRFMLFYETNSNLTIYYGESTSTSGTLTQKNLSSLKNMGGASSGAAGSAGFAPAPAAGDNLKFLRGDATWQNIPNMIGATSSAAGSAGLVPLPAAGNEGKFLRGDGTWQTANTQPFLMAVCDSQSTSVKQVTINGYTPNENTIILLYFKYAIANSATLNINGTGDYPLKFNLSNSDVLVYGYQGNWEEITISAGTLLLVQYVENNNNPYYKFTNLSAADELLSGYSGMSTHVMMCVEFWTDSYYHSCRPYKASDGTTSISFGWEGSPTVRFGSLQARCALFVDNRNNSSDLTVSCNTYIGDVPYPDMVVRSGKMVLFDLISTYHETMVSPPIIILRHDITT